MKVILLNAIQGFMTYYTPKAINNRKPMFSGTYIVDEETKIKAVNAEGKTVIVPAEKIAEVCNRVMKEKFGSVPKKHLNWCWNKADGSTTRDEYTNDDGDYHDGFDAETWFVSAKKNPEQLKDGRLPVMNQLKKPITAQSGDLKPGDRVNVIIDVYAFSGDNGKGVTASLEGVQLKKSGEALQLGGGSRIDAESEFDEEEIEGEDGGDVDSML